MKYLTRSKPKRVYERRVMRAASALPALRHEVANRLEDEGVPASTIDDTLLVLSELSTNAMHAIRYGEEIDVRVAITPTGDVEVEVEDPGAGFRLSEGLRLADQDDEHGRGLAIVCLVADETSVRRYHRRTVVRAKICPRRSA